MSLEAPARDTMMRAAPEQKARPIREWHFAPSAERAAAVIMAPTLAEAQALYDAGKGGEIINDDKK